MKEKDERDIADSFMSRLQEGEWWQKDNEILNMCDINQRPSYYKCSYKEWIEELTTYIFLCPHEWDEIYSEYLQIASDNGNSELRFYRNDEGYLRLTKTEKIYLKITGTDKPLSHTVLNSIGQMLLEQEEELFYSYLRYTDMSDTDKKLWTVHRKDEIVKHITKEINVTLTSTLDDFAEGELYFDLLNNTYIIF